METNSSGDELLKTSSKETNCLETNCLETKSRGTILYSSSSYLTGLGSFDT